MRLLLDTHIYLWCVKDDRQLSKTARNLILNASEVYISSVSVWEIAIKARLGKLEANIPALIEAITECGYSELPLRADHVANGYHLPELHKDPFDRILIAQAISEPLKFLTADKFLKQYSDVVEII